MIHKISISMVKSMIIIGMLQGLGLAVAEKFGKEGYPAGMTGLSTDN